MVDLGLPVVFVLAFGYRDSKRSRLDPAEGHPLRVDTERFFCVVIGSMVRGSLLLREVIEDWEPSGSDIRDRRQSHGSGGI